MSDPSSIRHRLIVALRHSSVGEDTDEAEALTDVVLTVLAADLPGDLFEAFQEQDCVMEEVSGWRGGDLRWRAAHPGEAELMTEVVLRLLRA